MIEVIGGAIIRANRILLGQRPAGKSYPFTWECPGGKVEGNESHHQALQRELNEELGIDAWVISDRSLWCGKFECQKDASGGLIEILLIIYPVTAYGGVFTSKEEQGFGWFDAEDLAHLKMTPGGILMRNTLVGALRG